MFGDPRSRLPVKFNGPDDPFYIVGVDLIRCRRIHLLKHLVKIFSALLPGNPLQLKAQGPVLIIFRKINVIGQSLDIKACPSHHHRDMAPV